MNASILRSASLAVAIAALSIGARESTAQSPFYSSVRPASYPTVPVTNYGTAYLNGSLYSTPVYGSTVYGNTGYAASPYINPSIAPGGCYGPTNGSVYRPNYPYGTAASDPYWNTRPNGWNNSWNNNSWNNQWSNNSWDNRWDSRWNNSWSSGRNNDRWRHDHNSSSTWDRSRDDRSRHNGTSGLFSPVRP